MFFRDHGMILVHQRKCAGTTLHRALGKLPREDKNMYQDGILSKEWDEEEVSGLLKVAVARNPWDRFISGWRYCPTTKERTLLDVLRDPPMEGHDYRHLTRPQVDTIRYPDGRWAIDALLSFERLQEGFDRLCDILGTPRAELPKLNVNSDGRDYREHYGPEERALLAEVMAPDIEALGYAHDAPGEPGLIFFPR